MSLAAWFEPTTLSVCLYFSCSLLSGHGGVRLLKRRLRKARYWGKDILTDELAEFLCDHPELLFIALLTTSTFKLVYHPKPSIKDRFLLGISGAHDFHGLPLSCHPSLHGKLSGSKRYICHSGRRLHLKLGGTLRTIRSATNLRLMPYPQDRGSDTLSYMRLMPLLRDGTPIERREEAVQDTGEHKGVCEGILPPHGLHLPSVCGAQRGSARPSVHRMRELAEAVQQRPAQEVQRQEADAADGSLRGVYARARQDHRA